MIVGVPDHNDLNATAVGWINLAWGIAIEEAEDFQQANVIFDEIEEKYGRERMKEAITEYWDGNRLVLNNAVTLLQQALEIFLKARIAAVSPFLLITDDVERWPKPDSSGRLDFSELRTIDSNRLCKAAKIICPERLPNGFEEFYEKRRKARNKIVHLNASAIKAELAGVLRDILQAQRYLFPAEPWIEFRRKYFQSGGFASSLDLEILGDEADGTANDTLNFEFQAMYYELPDDDLRKFFGYDSRKKGYKCPTCESRKAEYVDESWEFAQKQRGRAVRCPVCLSVFSYSQYKSAMLDRIHGGLPNEYKDELVASLEREFPTPKT
jgi:hypothetical protein